VKELLIGISVGNGTIENHTQITIVVVLFMVQTSEHYAIL